MKERYRQFHEWQQQPYQVAPLSEEAHDCATCGTHYVGNYCPRCGMSARIGRYSFKSASLLFLDVWGVGNRGMFRCIRDLILRPGYMIRDYLQGRQMAYFPPFKMFFLLAALNLIVVTGLNIRLENRNEIVEKEVEQDIRKTLHQHDDTAAENTATATTGESAAQLSEEEENTEDAARIEADFMRIGSKVSHFIEDNPNIFTILMLLAFSGPLWLFFRKCPAYPGIRFSEFFVAMVYTVNMLTVYSIIIDFFCINWLVGAATIILAVVPIKQLSGYSYWRTALMMLAALVVLLLIALFFLLLCIAIFAYIGIKMH